MNKKNTRIVRVRAEDIERIPEFVDVTYQDWLKRINYKLIKDTLEMILAIKGGWPILFKRPPLDPLNIFTYKEIESQIKYALNAQYPDFPRFEPLGNNSYLVYNKKGIIGRTTFEDDKKKVKKARRVL